MENGRSYRLHTVTKGEGLFRLSQNYGVTQEDIISANPKLKTEGLTEGLTLRIPATSTVQYTVKKGDTAYS
ncbi:MAG: LysM domain-containing protein, partial [Bacteroidales bacterium]|nr:LysM domain-containing protein [Bacteroidales bacterium]